MNASKPSFNARTLLFDSQVCSPLSSFHCSSCRGSGALLRCDRCSRSYHLTCSNLVESEVPLGSWYCRKCWTELEEQVNEDSERLEKRQKLKKDIVVRKFIKHLQGVDMHKLVKKLSKQSSRDTVHCEDLLDSFTSSTSLPVPEDPQPGENVLGSVIAIADFCYTFRDLLQLPIFTITQLDAELKRDTESPLLAQILANSLKVIIRHIFTRHGSSECIPSNCTYLSLAFQTHGLYNVIDYMSHLYFPFLTELLTCPMWSSYIQSGSLLANVVEKKRLDLPFESYFYGSYSYQEKAEILIWVTRCLLDCQELCETVRKLTGMRSGLRVKLKQLKNMKCDMGVIERDESIAQVKAKLRDAECVTKPFASCSGSELYHFPYDPMKICIRTLNEEEESWHVFESKRDLGKLLALDSHECRRKLRQTIKTEDKPTQEPVSDSPQSSVLLSLMSYMLLSFESRLSTYLFKYQKQWDTSENRELWMKKIQTANSVHELKWLLLELAEKGSQALKPQRVGKLHYKLRKQIWATLEFRETWGTLLENVSGMQELVLLMLFLASNWRHYAVKKDGNESHFPVSLFLPEQSKSELKNEGGDSNSGGISEKPEAVRSKVKVEGSGMNVLTTAADTDMAEVTPHRDSLPICVQGLADDPSTAQEVSKPRKKVGRPRKRPIEDLEPLKTPVDSSIDDLFQEMLSSSTKKESPEPVPKEAPGIEEHPPSETKPASKASHKKRNKPTPPKESLRRSARISKNRPVTDY